MSDTQTSVPAAPDPHLARRALIDPNLESGEVLRHWAYGIQVRSCLSGLLFAAALIPAIFIVWLLFGTSPGCLGSAIFWVLWFAFGTLITAKLRRDYLVGLTDRRLVVITLRTPLLFKQDFKQSLGVRHFDLSTIPTVTTKVTKRKVQIQLSHPNDGFDAAFPGGVFGNNHAHAVAIAEALSQHSTVPRPS